MYMNPVLNAPLGPDGLPVPVDPSKVQDFFEDFYEDIFLELDKFGEVEHLCVCDNLADHMVGNVYIKFRDEEGAARALQGFQGRYYAGKPIQVEFSPVTDFRESTCRQYEEGTCGRGGYCNFMHVRPVSRELRKQCFGRYKGGSGGSTRFHENSGRGGDRRRNQRGDGGGGGRRYDDRRGGGGGRYDDYNDRGRSRYDDRRGGGGGNRDRDDSAERRARIAQWNSQSGTGGAAAAPAAAAPVFHNYGGAAAAVPAAAYGSFAAPPQQQQQYGGGGGGNGDSRGRGRRGYDAGGSGANTVPIAGMRSFPNYQD
jgi:splicing factor U2AF 35 kDa subunit